jgi:hypothetical protein
MKGNGVKVIIKAFAGLLAFIGVDVALAQSTDGYHSWQVFPVVVDSTSFVQRFSFTTSNTFPVTVYPTFNTGIGAPSITPDNCPSFIIPANGKIAFASLRDLCPQLSPGSLFGFLTLRSGPSSDDMYSDIPVFAGVSRVSNAAGAGFSVEAFPAHTFSPANTAVTGLRRVAATGGSPAYQSNCFVGDMPDDETNIGGEPGTPLPEKVNYTVHAGGSNYSSSLTVLPGSMVRLLDVFAAAGVPVGDVDEASVDFVSTHFSGEHSGLITFCTVQENSNYTADFRIGKVSRGSLGIATGDFLGAREWSAGASLGRKFEIDPGSNANTHIVYFRNPDTINCQLLDPASFAPLTPTAGLELRLLNTAGNKIGGGNDAVATGQLYLGDKRTTAGINYRYTVEVESNEQNVGVVRGYQLYCASGSGNTTPEIARYKEAIDRF